MNLVPHTNLYDALPWSPIGLEEPQISRPKADLSRKENKLRIVIPRSLVGISLVTTRNLLKASANVTSDVTLVRWLMESGKQAAPNGATIRFFIAVYK